MKALKLALISSAAIVAVAGFASAASAAPPTVAYNAGISTDYIFRGIDQSPGIFLIPGTSSQTLPVFSTTAPFAQTGTVTVPGTPSSLIFTPNNSSEVFGGIDVASGPLYAGVWVSNTGPDRDEGLETDLYAGYKAPLGAATLDLGVISYNYSNGSFVTNNADNYELKAALTVPAGSWTLGGSVFWTPKFGGKGGSAGEYYEANFSYTLKDKATVSGAYGYQAVAKKQYGTGGYETWNIGVTYPVTDKVSLDARYIGTSSSADSVGTAQRGRAVGTVKVSF